MSSENTRGRPLSPFYDMILELMFAKIVDDFSVGFEIRVNPSKKENYIQSKISE